jgi:8-oxo-dGTP diphosphatase
MRFNVFISYCSRDYSSVQLIVQRLRQQGFSVWLDRDELLAGAPLIEGIEQGLKSSETIVVCIGSSGMGTWQTPEIQIAVNLSIENPGKRVIPVLLPDAPETVEFPLFLKRVLWIDFRQGLNKEDEWEKLFRSLTNKDNLKVSDESVTSSKIISPSSQRIRDASSLAIIKDNCVLLVKRAKSQKVAPELWQLPGGKVEQGEPALVAAIREAKEELNLDIASETVNHITDISDVWLDKKTGKSLVMHLYWAPFHGGEISLEDSLSEYQWVNIDEVFSQQDLILFGSTTRLLRIIRRYFRLHLPLLKLTQALEHLENSENSIPNIDGINPEASQVLYALLSLFGFLDDRGPYRSSSILSASIIKLLSFWSLTESQIFENQGNNAWYNEALKVGGKKDVERFQSKFFEEHQSILGLLSYRLPKAISSRSVCDIIITAKQRESNKTLVLLRWDFVANKFQIVAKGLEALDGELTANSIHAAHYAVEKRMGIRSIDWFNYKPLGNFNTMHIGAGSLNDGPIARNYNVIVYGLEVKPKDQINVVHCLTQINNETLRFLKESTERTFADKASLQFYVWAELDLIKEDPVYLLGIRLQGADELIKNLGISIFEFTDNLLLIDPKSNKIPILSNSSEESIDGITSFFRQSKTFFIQPKDNDHQD